MRCVKMHGVGSLRIQMDIAVNCEFCGQEIVFDKFMWKNPPYKVSTLYGGFVQYVDNKRIK